jgi:8-oxo-dGTP diphosphatase
MRTREYPELPMVGVGGVIVSDQRVLLVRRGTDPARGEWTIPGGLLEVGETLMEGVAREILEETSLKVRVLELVEALERIFFDPPEANAKPRYHFVILDYLCEVLEGEPQANEEITELAFVHEQDLHRYQLTPAVRRVLHKAFAMTRSRATF